MFRWILSVTRLVFIVAIVCGSLYLAIIAEQARANQSAMASPELVTTSSARTTTTRNAVRLPHTDQDFHPNQIAFLVAIVMSLSIGVLLTYRQ